MKFTAEVASLTSSDKNGQAFSSEALQQIAEQCRNKPIYIDFDTSKPPVGSIFSGEVRGDKVEVTGVIFPSAYKKDRFIVPSYSIGRSVFKDKVQIHTDIKLVDFGLTREPADLNIKEIQKGGDR